MRNRLLFVSRRLLGPLLFVFVLSFALGTGYGKEFRNPKTQKPKIGEKAFRFNKDHPRLRAAIEAHRRHTKNLMDTFGVVGTGIGIAPDGEPVVRVFTAKAGLGGIPQILDGVPVRVKATGRFYALADPRDRFPRPVPIGVSTGHPDITAGTIGCRVTDGANVFALSNNHVYATVNTASIGVDNVLQPGAFDGGVDPGDAIGTLSDFEEIKFCTIWWFWLICSETNTIDAAIALSSTSDLGYVTPADGYGTPSAVIHPAFGDLATIGDEDLSQLLGEGVQKYGRTTRLTTGTVSTISATVDVCYDDACSLIGRFVDQIIITPGTFSGGGDSGSLIVSQDGNQPVGLLFAGSDYETIANRIDLVLNRFGVTVDEGIAEPVTDLAVTMVSAPASVVLGTTVDVSVTVENMGNQNVESCGVTLTDTTDGLTIETQPVTNLAPGSSTTLTYEWDTKHCAVDGPHTLEATHDAFPDADASNDVATTSVVVAESLMDVAVTAVNAPASVTQGDTVRVNVTVENIGNQTVGPFNVTLTNVTEGSNTDTPQTVSSLATGVSTTLEYLWDTTDATMVDTDHTLKAEHTLADDNMGNNASTTTVEVTAPIVSDGPLLQTGIVMASTEGWTTVDLSYDYGENMVVVCTPNYAYNSNLTPPLVVRVRNASGNSFEVGLTPPVFGLLPGDGPWDAPVHYVVVREGVYDEVNHGVTMEAVKFPSTVTDRSGSWVGEERTYQQTYDQPVVVGQVMTYDNDIDVNPYYWSVFWARGSRSTNPPSRTALFVGKHIGEDINPVNTETIGYVVIEAGSGTIDSTNYQAGLGTDTVRGMGNGPPFVYSINGLSNPSVAILAQAAMDGANGGWAILYGSNPIGVNGSNTEVRTAIEEDWWRDSERRHTTEQVAYILFE